MANEPDRIIAAGQPASVSEVLANKAGLTAELRCDSKKHAELHDNVIEVKCSSRFCGASSEVVVIHRFDARTGELLTTTKYKSIKIGVRHGS